MTQPTGGWTPVQKATPEIQHIADQVRGDFETKTQRTFKTFVAETYSSQVVAGVNYKITVRVDHSEHVDLHVFKDLQGHVQLQPDTFGGWTPVQKATPEIQHIADQVKGEYETKTQRTFKKFVAETYSSQVVAGVNYKITVRVDHSEHVDLHVVKDLQGHVQLHPDTFGGWTPVQKATPEIQHIADQAKGEYETKTQRTFKKFVAETYTSQVVAGVNYKITVRVDHSEHVDLHVFKDLQGHVQLHPDTFGGWTQVQKATPEIQHIADQVKGDFEAKTQRTFKKFVAETYSCQVVAGVNYKITVRVDHHAEHVDLQVFKDLQGHVQLHPGPFNSGGWAPVQKADPEIQHIADQVRGEYETRTQRTFKEFVAETYSSQIVAGVNYKITVRVDHAEHVVLHVFKDLQRNLQLQPELVHVPGGWTQVQKATPEIQLIADQVRGEYETKTQKTFKEFVAETYSSQVVAGVNYKIMVRVDQSEHIDLHVFKDLQGHVQLQPELVPEVMDGGWMPVQKATPQIQYIADQVRQEYETRTQKTFKEFVAKTYSSQVVAGVNYKITVRVDQAEYVELHVFKDLLGHLQLQPDSRGSGPGQWTPVQKAGPEIQHIADQVRGEYETKTQKTFKKFVAKTYSSQVVAGVNYKITVHVDQAEYVELHVFIDTQGHVQLSC